MIPYKMLDGAWIDLDSIQCISQSSIPSTRMEYTITFALQNTPKELSFGYIPQYDRYSDKEYAALMEKTVAECEAHRNDLVDAWINNAKSKMGSK